jgi:hypothetical protein
MKFILGCYIPLISHIGASFSRSRIQTGLNICACTDTIHEFCECLARNYGSLPPATIRNLPQHDTAQFFPRHKFRGSKQDLNKLYSKIATLYIAFFHYIYTHTPLNSRTSIRQFFRPPHLGSFLVINIPPSCLGSLDYIPSSMDSPDTHTGTVQCVNVALTLPQSLISPLSHLVIHLLLTLLSLSNTVFGPDPEKINDGCVRIIS